MNKQTIVRETYKVDATNIPLGRLATDIAKHLMGKHRADYVPHVDSGDIVEVSNAAAVRVTGKKMEQYTYYSHSNHPGGLKAETMRVVFEKDPGEIIRRSVSRMLPKNRHRDERLKRLKIVS